MTTIREQYGRILALASFPEAPRDIEDRVMRRIQSYRFARTRARIVVYAASGMVAFAAAAPVFVAFASAIKRSGFYEYLSIFVSDGLTTFADWKALSLSILESLPILETAAVLAVMLVLANALRMVARNLSYRNALSRNGLATI